MLGDLRSMLQVHDGIAAIQVIYPVVSTKRKGDFAALGG
jgi:hypothetical protein